MKRLIVILTLLSVLLASTQAQAESSEYFSIDEVHIYEKMDRSYAQGYQPLVERNKAYIVLPIISSGMEGDITAELVPANVAITPFILPQNLKQTVSKRAVSFGKERFSVYLVQFVLPLFADRVKGDYPYRIELEGNDRSGAVIKESFEQILYIREGEAPDAPQLTLELIGENEALEVGEKGEVRLRLRNESETQTLSGLKLVLSDPKEEILPLVSDTVLLDDLGALDSIDITWPVRILAKAAAQPHALSLKLSFLYAGGIEGLYEEKLTLNLIQEARLNYTEPQLPVRLTQGETSALGMTFMNMGKGELHNVRMRFNIPGLAAGGTILVGNLEAGESKQGSANLRAAADYIGETKGTMTIEYEDAYGKAYSKELPLSGTIEEKKKLVFEEDEKDEDKSSLGTREIVAWVLSILLMISLAAQSIVLRNRLHKLEERNL